MTRPVLRKIIKRRKRCITAIEIEGEQITLVKWEVKTRPNNDMYVGREVMEGPYYIKEYFGEPKKR